MKCPLKSNPEFKEMKSIFGEEKATSLWVKNNGNPLNKTYSGNSSILFKDLESQLGSKIEANRVKSLIFTLDYEKTHGQTYIRDSNIPLDRNNEPFSSSVLEYSKSGPINPEALITNESTKQLENLLKDWATSNGIRIEAVDNLKEKYGINAIAIADIADMAIRYSKGKLEIKDLSEEVSHFIIEGLGKDHPTVARALELVDQTKMWAENIDLYMKEYNGDIEKIKMEIVGKLMSQTIMSGSQDIINSESNHNEPLISRILKLFKAILDQFNKLVSKSKENVVDSMITTSFGKLAKDVLDGSMNELISKNLEKSNQFYASAEKVGLKEDLLTDAQKQERALISFINESTDLIIRRSKDIYAKGDKESFEKESIRLNNTAKKILNIAGKGTSSLPYAMRLTILALNDINKEKLNTINSIGSIENLSEDDFKEVSKKINSIGKSLNVYKPIITKFKNSVKNVEFSDKRDKEDELSYKELINLLDEILIDEVKIEGAYNDVASDLTMKKFSEEVDKALKTIPGMTKEKLKELLINADKDITSFGSSLLSLSQMDDIWLSMMNSDFQQLRQIAMQEAIKSRDVVLEASEKLSKETGSNNTDFMYSDEIMQVSNYDINKYNSEQSSFISSLIEKHQKKSFNNFKVFFPSGTSSPKTIIIAYELAKKQLKSELSIEEFEEEYKRDFLEPMARWYLDNLTIEENTYNVDLNSIESLEQFIIDMRDNVSIHEFVKNQPKPAKKYFTGAVNKLTKPQKEYYNSVMPELIKYDNQLGNSGLKFMMPQIEKDVIETLIDDGVTSSFKEFVGDSVFSRANDMVNTGKSNLSESGEEAKSVMVWFTNELKDPAKISKDATSTILAFNTKAIQSISYRKSIDSYEILKNMIGNRQVAGTHKKTDNIKSALDGFFNNVFYGKSKQIYVYNYNGKEYRVDKMFDALASYTAVTALGINIYAAIANPILGSQVLRQEGFAKEFWTNSDLNKASFEYASKIGGVLRDMGSVRSSSHLRLFMELVDATQDIDSDLERAGVKKGAIGRLMNTSSLFFMNHAGEHMLHGVAAIAMGEKYARTIGLKDSDGKEIGLFDAFEVSGKKLVIKKGVTKKDGNSLNENDIATFSKKLAHTNNQLHGIYNKVDSSNFQRTIHGSLMLMFRKFIVPGFMRRWGKQRYDAIHEGQREGFHMTSFKFMRSLVLDLIQADKDLKNSSISISDRYNKLSEHEKANIRRSITEVAQYAVLSLIAAILSELGDDDDDWITQMGAYQAMRVGAEVAFFMNPAETLKLLQDPIPAGDGIEKIIETIVRIFSFWSWDEEYQSGINKGENKTLTSIKYRIPLWKTIDGFSHPDQKRQFFN